MKRHVGIFAVLALLALPLVAGAQQIEGSSCRSWDDTGCMPSWWTPTPPARETVDPARLKALLEKRGVITAQEAAQLALPQVPTLAGEGRERLREAMSEP